MASETQKSITYEPYLLWADGEISDDDPSTSDTELEGCPIAKKLGRCVGRKRCTARGRYIGN